MARLMGTKEDVALLENEIKKKRRLEKETVAAVRSLAIPPALVAIPEHCKTEASPAPKMLTQGEAEHIEAEAAKMKVLELKPKTPDPLFITEPDRYEALLEKESKNPDALSLDDMQFMRYFEKTEIYKEFRDRFEFVREFFIAGPETC